MDTANLTQTRTGTDADIPLISDSWMHGLKDNACGTRAKDVSFIVSQCLQVCKSICIVSVDDPGFILGYICYEEFNGRNIIYWIYTKASFRKMGLARKLVNAAFGEMPRLTCVACPTPLSQISQFFTAVTMQWEYNPLLLARRLHVAANKVNQHT